MVADRACAVPCLQLFEFFALRGDLVSNLRSVSTSLLPIRVFLCDGHIYIPPHRCCASTTMHIRSSLARLLFMKGSRSFQQALLRKQSGATTHCCKSFVSGRKGFFSDTRWPTAADRGVTRIAPAHRDHTMLHEPQSLFSVTPHRYTQHRNHGTAPAPFTLAPGFFALSDRCCSLWCLRSFLNCVNCSACASRGWCNKNTITCALRFRRRHKQPT